MSELRVALFVEGSEGPPPPRGDRPFEKIWNQHLQSALGLRKFELIIPISKTHLVAMDKSNPPMSGQAEALDQLIVRKQETRRFDAAVVAWDLVPPWNPTAGFCRRQEVLGLYRGLASSACLPEALRQAASRRLTELEQRLETPFRLTPGMIGALCMEPMFEGLLICEEKAILRALELKARPKEWPRGWNEKEKSPDRNLLSLAISAARRARPRPKPVKLVRGDYRTQKDGWGEYLLRHLLDHPGTREAVLGHPIARRLAAVSPRAESR